VSVKLCKWDSADLLSGIELDGMVWYGMVWLPLREDAAEAHTRNYGGFLWVRGQRSLVATMAVKRP